MHVRLHEFLVALLATGVLWRASSPYLDKVDFGEGLIVPRLLDVEDGDDVFVVEISQQLHLSQCSQTEHGVVEGRNLLDGDLLA
jgi:hypothetical protein